MPSRSTVKAAFLRADVDGVVRLFDPAAVTEINIMAGGGDDVISISPTTQDLGSIPMPVLIDGGPGDDTLEIRDGANLADSTYSLEANGPLSTFRRTAPATADIDLVGVDSVVVYGGNGYLDTYNVESTASNTKLELHGGAGFDTFHVSPAARDLDTIHGTLTLFGEGNNDNVCAHDEAEGARPMTSHRPP